MNKSVRIGTPPTLILLLLIASDGYAHPSRSPHSHNSSNVAFEYNDNNADDGSAYHNHMFPVSFGGISQTARQPYTAFGCWDNSSWRGEYFDLEFDRGHCFINNVTDIQSVTYSFEGTWNNNAKEVFRYAFGRFNAISTFATTIVPHGITGNQIGIEFSEVSSGGDILLFSVNTLSPPGTGAVGIFLPADWWQTNLRGAHYIEIANAPWSGFEGWDYSLTPATEDASKWHLLTVALHEIGHAAGLHHQEDSDDLMYANQNSPVGAPSSWGPRKIHYDVDLDSEVGIYHLYGQTPTIVVPPPPSCDLAFEFRFCNGSVPGYSVTATLDGYELLFADYDMRLPGSSTWTDIYDGSPHTCPASIFDPATWIRAFLHTTAGVSECTIFVPILNDCQNPDDNPWQW